ncbi:MAG TPA: inositol monophosphatase family protein [Roseiflexaceae bacterium]|nr:inositol monophosphatase family protein [Roseiflexaceae bacterium]
MNDSLLFRDVAVDLVRRAGALLLDGLARVRQIERKAGAELVTDIDHASEALLVAGLSQHFPDHSIRGEEGGGASRPSPYTWLIDPLDGTNNYAHGFPFFCVTVALLLDGEPVLGVTLDPLRDELFVAEAGRGAWCNDRPLRVSAAAALADALVSTGFPYDFASNPANNAPEFARVHARVQGVRRAGAAALDLAYVAMGRLDAHWELRLKPWDAAAGALLVREAGGALSDWRGGRWTTESPDLIASNGLLHAELVAALD